MVHVNRVVVTMLGDATQFNRMADQVISKTMQMTASFTSMGAGLSRMFNMGAGGAFLGGFVGALVGLATGGTLSLISAGVDAITGSFERMANLAQLAGERIVQIGTYILETGMKFELFRADFETMTGSIQKGAKLFEQVKELTIRTPYTFEQLARANQLLLGMGVAPEHSIAVLSRLGDIAGGNALRFQRLALAYGQVVSAGRFMGTELRQFSEAGMGAADFAKASGMSGGDLRALMGEGRATVGMMIRGINAVTSGDGRFANRNQRVFQTVAGQWIALRERIEISVSEMAERIFTKFNLANRISQFSTWITRIFKLMESESGPFLDRFMGWAGRGEGSLYAAAEILGKIVILLGKGAVALEPYVPTWEQVERTLIRISENTLPRMAEMLQKMLKGLVDVLLWVSETVDINMNSPATGILTNKLVGTHPAGFVLQDLFKEGNKLWSSAFGEDLKGSNARLKNNLEKMSNDLGQANWFWETKMAGVEFRRFVNTIKKSDSAMNSVGAMMGGMGQAAVNFAAKVDKIPEPEELKLWKISDAAERMADNLLGEGMGMISPLQKLKDGLAAMDEAFWGPKGIGEYSLNGPVATGPLAGRRDLFDLGRLQAFEAARRMLGPEPEDMWDKMENRLPKAIVRGSKEAFDTMQRSVRAARAEVPLDERQKALRDLVRIREAHEESKKRLGIIADVLKEIQKNGGLEGLGF